ncbi:MAG: ABC transporter permease subunit [Planctomycetota bacterium]|nr:ABC transporter permease subunit [Planctomycetota bacterium]
MITQLIAIAKNAFVESVRQPVLFTLVLLAGIIQVFNTFNAAFSMADVESSQVSGDTKLLFDIGLGTIFVISTLLAGFIATAVISREIENKTVLTVISKPIPRPVLVLGKFAGVAGAMLAALVVMLVFLLLAVRHGVMSTAADELDGPVIFFGVGFVALSLFIAGWCNFFYGWNFPQTLVTLLVPLSILAYVLVLFVGKKWNLQPPLTDFKDQVMVASLCLGLAVLVLTSVALAASTRLGQVMTLVVSMGVFVGALLSNHMIGQHVFDNAALGRIQSVSPEDPERASFRNLGDTLVVRLSREPLERPRPGDPVYFSPGPSGFPMLAPTDYARFSGALNELTEQLASEQPPAIIVLDSSGATLRVRHIGGRPLAITRAPEPDDYVFSRPTSIRPVALAAWGAIPNLQFFWLLDAVSQNRRVPAAYVGLVSLYAACQVGVFLSLAVLLFQRRDVG